MTAQTFRAKSSESSEGLFESGSKDHVNFTAHSEVQFLPAPPHTTHTPNRNIFWCQHRIQHACVKMIQIKMGSKSPIVQRVRNCISMLRAPRLQSIDAMAILLNLHCGQAQASLMHGEGCCTGGGTWGVVKI